jgi:hypothetical protein
VDVERVLGKVEELSLLARDVGIILKLGVRLLYCSLGGSVHGWLRSAGARHCQARGQGPPQIPKSISGMGKRWQGVGGAGA